MPDPDLKVKKEVDFEKEAIISVQEVMPDPDPEVKKEVDFEKEAIISVQEVMPDPDLKVKKEVDLEKEATAQPFPVPLMVYAQVTRLATDDVESSSIKKEEKSSSSNEDNSNTTKRVEEILNVVKKEETGEDEAKYALQLSAKVLSSANSKETREILHEDSKKEDQRGGHSVVTIRRKDGGDIHVRKWTFNIADAIAKAFNVKRSYWDGKQDNTRVAFYGLRDNTVAAAMSFEAIFNLALTWAANRQNKNCYLLGLSSSIYEMTEAEQKAEEEQAVKNEKSLFKERNPENDKKKRAQTTSSKTKAIEVTDEDDDGNTKRAESSKSSHRSVKVEMKPEVDENALINKKRPISDDEEIEFVGWQSHAQLIEFRKMAGCIAIEYYKKLGWKLHRRPIPEKAKVDDDLTYQSGQKDARNVNLKRPRLEFA